MSFPISNPFSLPSNLKKYQKTSKAYKANIPNTPKPLASDTVTFRGNDKVANIKKAGELIKNGAKVYHVGDGSYKFVDANGKILEATENLQNAMDAGNFSDAVIEASDELVNEAAGELAKAALDFALAACVIQ